MSVQESKGESPLREPEDLVVRDWQDRLCRAKEAFELGRKTMVPQSTLPLPLSLVRPE